MNLELLNTRARILKARFSIIISVIFYSLITGFLSLSETKLTSFFKVEIIYFLLLCPFILILYLIIQLFSQKKYKNHYFIGTLLCLVFSISLSLIIFTNTSYYQLFLYLISLMIYHYSEYLSVVFYHIDDLNISHFLLDQSKEWVFSCTFSLLEVLIETYFFGKYKKNKIIFIIGIIMTIIGHFFRISALYTGKSNFTHEISYDKKKNHRLVTYGIYSLSRHPSYFGFYLWSIGTQVMCCNPICIIGFTIALYIFFKERILREECLLIEFFGYQY